MKKGDDWGWGRRAIRRTRTRTLPGRSIRTESGKGTSGRGSVRRNERKPARRRGGNAGRRGRTTRFRMRTEGKNPFAALHAAGNGYPPQQQQQVYAPPAHGQRPARKLYGSRSNASDYYATTTTSSANSFVGRGSLPERQRIPTQRGPALAIIAAFAGAALHGVPQSGRRAWDWDAVGVVWGDVALEPRCERRATSTFTPYAECDRERKRERGREGARFTAREAEGDACEVGVVCECVNVGYSGTGTTPFTAVRVRSTPAQQSYEYVPPQSTVVQYPPQSAAQIAAVSASSNTSGSQHHQQQQHGEMTHLPAPVSSFAVRPCIPALASPAFSFDDEPARVAVRAPARGDAAAAAFVLCFLFDRPLLLRSHPPCVIRIDGGFLGEVLFTRGRTDPLGLK
ncbi:hypothetical protein B0H16DRAFT_1861505 [Mycena metata]|uniref:Uncharacterized protein n=1 Tax=Mycena metata TaxID=1033252 RepID=A0AAD7IHN3_9AGAR|nr:hypothetical protein B0H16DRAFT_1861505 [Mycena metata]